VLIGDADKFTMATSAKFNSRPSDAGDWMSIVDNTVSDWITRWISQWGKVNEWFCSA